MVHRVPFDIRTEHISRRAVSVDVIGAVLGYVFENEDGRFRPERVMGNMFYQFPQGKIVVGNLRNRAIGSFLHAAGMVIREIDSTEMRYGSCLQQRIEIMFENGFPVYILYPKIPSGLFLPLVIGTINQAQ